MSEVEVDRFTGAYRLLRTDILEDVGDSISPVIDRGQIEGGFLQGVGWLTLEELLWDDEGRLATGGASTYKLPSWSEVPDVFEVAFLERATQPGVVFGSKAVGEPPLMLAISVREAIRDAVAAFGGGARSRSPARPRPNRCSSRCAAPGGARGAAMSAPGDVSRDDLHTRARPLAEEARSSGTRTAVCWCATAAS